MYILRTISTLGVLLCPLALALAQAPAPADSGQAIFRRDCGFCHGPDAGGGETGPDLTRSKVVADDTAGSTLAPVIRNGRPDKGMPGFRLSDSDLTAVVSFIHNQKTKAESQKGGRKGVDPSDLQTGDAAAGKRYFDGACASCHSAAGDLSGVGKRLKGLRLEQRMLYPRGAKETLTVKTPNGETVTGTGAYRDEFTVALRDAAGRYRSWPADKVTYTVSAPAEAHADLLSKYTDADVHNLMAYLQTLL